MEKPLDHFLDIGYILILLIFAIVGACSQAHALDVSYVGSSISYHGGAKQMRTSYEVNGSYHVPVNERHSGGGLIFDLSNGWGGMMYHTPENSYGDDSTFMALRKKVRFSIKPNRWYLESSVNLGAVSGYDKSDIDESLKKNGVIPYLAYNTTLIKALSAKHEVFANMSIVPSKTPAIILNFGTTFKNLRF